MSKENIDCIYCGEFLDTIILEKNWTCPECVNNKFNDLKSENKKLKKINETLFYFSEKEKEKLQAENKRLMDDIKLSLKLGTFESTLECLERAIEKTK